MTIDFFDINHNKFSPKIQYHSDQRVSQFTLQPRFRRGGTPKHSSSAHSRAESLIPRWGIAIYRYQQCFFHLPCLPKWLRKCKQKWIFHSLIDAYSQGKLLYSACLAAGVVRTEPVDFRFQVDPRLHWSNATPKLGFQLNGLNSKLEQATCAQNCHNNLFK